MFSYSNSKFLIVVTALCTSWFCSCVDQEVFFTSEPRNVTVTAGDSVKFNCSSQRDDLIAVWVLNRSQYYWADFQQLDDFSFNLLDNSLTVLHAPEYLDGTSFQCILDLHMSQVGYLTVFSNDSDNITSAVESQYTHNTEVDNVTPTSPIHLTSDNSSKESITIIANSEQGHVKVIEIAAPAAAMLMLVVIVFVLIILLCCAIVRRKKARETFTMKDNELYGTHRRNLRFLMNDNQSYSHREAYLEERLQQNNG